MINRVDLSDCVRTGDLKTIFHKTKLNLHKLLYFSKNNNLHQDVSFSIRSKTDTVNEIELLIFFKCCLCYIIDKDTECNIIFYDVGGVSEIPIDYHEFPTTL